MFSIMCVCVLAMKNAVFNKIPSLFELKYGDIFSSFFLVLLLPWFVFKNSKASSIDFFFIVYHKKWNFGEP